MQKSMVWFASALALGACGQNGLITDERSADDLSKALDHRRAEQNTPESANSAVLALRERAGADRACDAGAAESGGSSAEPPAHGHADSAGASAAEPRASRDGGQVAGSSASTRDRRRDGGGASTDGSAGAGAQTANPSSAGAPANQPPVTQPPANHPPVANLPASNPSSHFHPSPGTSWQIQLTGNIDTSVDAQVFDLDLFETSAADIATLHAAGRKVICYFDTAYESYRPDSKQLEPYRGNPIEGWPGQYWLDIRQPGVVDVMNARIALAQSKGCDAVDADDVDSRSNNPGFPIGAADQQNFVQQLATAAHSRGIAFGLKNALEDLQALSSSVDFSVNEECFVYDECDLLKPLIAAGKPVFQIEYADDSLESRAAEICPKAAALGFDTIIKRLELDAARRPCR